MLTTLLLVISTVIAIEVEDLGTTFELVGAISGVSIGLVLPALCYIMLPEAVIARRSYPWTTRCCYATVVIGVVSMIACVVSILV